MSELIGKLIVCDRCGNSCFLKNIGEGEADGVFTRWNKFEPEPKGWGYSPRIGSLCPVCSSEYEKLIDNFMNNATFSLQIKNIGIDAVKEDKL